MYLTRLTVPTSDKVQAPLQPPTSNLKPQLHTEQTPPQIPRRAVVALPGLALATTIAPTSPAVASALPESVDNLWERAGGGPADLTFPEHFLGTWQAVSTLTNIELPLGKEYVANMKVVDRAYAEDLNKAQIYQIMFTKNGRGRVVFDRGTNMAQLLNLYMGIELEQARQRIRWDIDNPNNMRLSLPGELLITTRVTRRSEEELPDNRLETSEFYQEVMERPEQTTSVKASQIFTKYKWRSREQAAADNGPEIIASQIVSDYLTPFGDAGMMMKANGKPVTIYSYKVAFNRPS